MYNDYKFQDYANIIFLYNIFAYRWLEWMGYLVRVEKPHPTRHPMGLVRDTHDAQENIIVNLIWIFIATNEQNKHTAFMGLIILQLIVVK